MKKVFFIIITVFLAIACNKSDDNSTPTNTTPTTPQPTKSELLTASVWKYQAWTVDPPEKDSLGNDVSDIYSFKPACEKDDLLRFKTNGNMEFDQGATKCNPNADQIITNVWFFNKGETTLSFGGATYQLDKLTADTLRISFDNFNTVIHHHTITFVH
jgi:hypothetical protein